jgi:hypothetical protein
VPVVGAGGVGAEEDSFLVLVEVTFANRDGHKDEQWQHARCSDSNHSGYRFNGGNRTGGGRMLDFER